MVLRCWRGTVGERLGQVTVGLQEGGCGRVTGQSLDGQSPGAAQSFSCLWADRWSQSRAQLQLVPRGFLSFVQLLWVGSWSLAGAAGWNRGGADHR